MFGKMVSDMMIKPGRSPVFNKPSELGLDYQDVSFTASDGVTLVAGSLETQKKKSSFNLISWCNAVELAIRLKGKGFIKMWKEDISFLRQAKHLADNGYSVLMYDFRNHGESDLGRCPWVSWGPEEAKDVVAAVNSLPVTTT